ncbi:hypothetical protein EDB87DRAFT_1201282 [Lactarius vividus]|nr:hypothetical protein EDB87DRAFT_1201282 [Lactarius vividus]
MAKFVHQLIPLFILATLLLPPPIEYTRNSIQLQRTPDLRPRSDGRVRSSCCMLFLQCCMTRRGHRPYTCDRRSGKKGCFLVHQKSSSRFIQTLSR